MGQKQRKTEKAEEYLIYKLNKGNIRIIWFIIKSYEMIYEKLQQNQIFVIPAQQQMSFYLFNIAIDPSSAEAALFIVEGGKEILIAELSRLNGGTRSLSLGLEFLANSGLTLISKQGSIHIIGGFKNSSIKLLQSRQMENKNTDEQKNINIKEKNQLKGTQNSQKGNIDSCNKVVSIEPLRRSTRARPPVKTNTLASAKAAKRQKQELKNIASLLGCVVDDQQQDDDSFERNAEGSSSSSSESESDSESMKKNHKNYDQRKKENEKIIAEEEKQQPLRRSIRARKVVQPAQNMKNKSAKREKEQLKNIGKLLDYEMEEQEQDDESFSQKAEQSSEQSESNEIDEEGQCEKRQKEDNLNAESQQEGGCRKKKVNTEKKGRKEAEEEIKGWKERDDKNKQKQNGLHFSVPTRNPYA